MPVYGQSTEFNERLSSLMSCVFCNSNDLYDGIDHSVKIFNSVAPPHLRSRRPLYTESILRKSSRLKEIESKPKSEGRKSILNKPTSVLEIVLVANREDSSRCTLLSNLVSHLFSMPEEHSNGLVLEVTAVRSNSIREDLAAACSSRSLPGSGFAAGKERCRIFVGLGSALEGLCLYLHQEEVALLRLRDKETMMPSRPLLLSTPAILAVVCVDPPSHHWKACGRSILDQSSIQGISSFFVSYTEKDDEGVERIPIGVGKLLNDCGRYPRALALVANSSAKILRSPSGSSILKEEKYDFDALVWTAKLVAKYTESIQRIRSPPRWPSSGTTPGNDEGPIRSML